MALEQRTINLLMDSDPEPTEHQIRLLLGDQMRAELEVKRRGMTAEYAVNLGSAAAWAAMVRTGQYDGDLEKFATDCLAMERHEDQPVDPTQPAASSEPA
jgi:hypothetical protein